MSIEPGMKSALVMLKAIVDLAQAGLILDVAFVAIPKEGDAMQGFSIAPKKPQALIDGLFEVAAWAGQADKNAAIEKARAELTI